MGRDMMTDLRVRVATHDDLGAIVETEGASFSTPWSRETFAALLDRERVIFVVLEATESQDGAVPEVVGHAILTLSLPDAEIVNIAVRPTWRGGGYGRLLLEALVAEASAREVERIFLEVRESNDSARALYGRKGFVPIGRRTRYYRMPVEDALVLALDLGKTPAPGMRSDRPASIFASESVSNSSGDER